MTKLAKYSAKASVRELRGLGISPDLIVCRSEKRVDESVKEKISNFCHVRPDQVNTYRDGLQDRLRDSRAQVHAT